MKYRLSAYIWPVIFVGFLLSGRWSLTRIYETMQLNVYFMEPRMLFASLLVVASLLFIDRLTVRGCVIIGSFGAFALVWLISAAYAPEGALSIGKAIDIIYLSIGVISALVLFNAPGRLRALVRVLYFALISMAVLATIMIFLGQGGRIAILGGGPNIFGRNMAILCMLSIIYNDHSISRQRLPYKLSVLLGGSLLLLTQSRGAVFSLGCALIAYYVFVGKIRPFVIFRAVFAGSVLGLVVWFTDLKVTLLGPIASRFTYYGYGEGMLGARYDLFVGAFNMWRENWLLGKGIGTTSISIGFYPHNVLLEILAEVGLVGLVALIVFIAASLSTKGIRRPFLNIPVLIIAIVVFAGAQFSGDIYDSRFLFSVLPLLWSENVLMKFKTNSGVSIIR